MGEDWFPTREELEDSKYELTDRQIKYAEQERARWIDCYLNSGLPQQRAVYDGLAERMRSLSDREVLLKSSKLWVRERIQKLQQAHERTGRDSDPSHKYGDLDWELRRLKLSEAMSMGAEEGEGDVAYRILDLDFTDCNEFIRGLDNFEEKSREDIILAR